VKKNKSNGKIVLIAGATGYIGRNLVEKLDKSGFRVIRVVRNTGSIKKTSSIKTIKVDICQTASVDLILRSVKQVDIIISCVGSRNGTRLEAKEVEYAANMHLLQLGRHLKVDQFILLSAICVQKPQLLFQKSKLRFENQLRGSNLNWTIIRPTAFFKSLAGQIERVQKGKPFIVFDYGLNNKFKPLSAKDLCDFICGKILHSNAFQKIFVVGGPGPAMSPKEQGELLFKILNKPKRFFYVPSFLFRLFLCITYPFGLIFQKCDDFREFLKIGLFYATESMLHWDEEKNQYDESKTPETGMDTLEGFYRKAIANPKSCIEIADKKLFSIGKSDRSTQI